MVKQHSARRGGVVHVQGDTHTHRHVCANSEKHKKKTKNETSGLSEKKDHSEHKPLPKRETKNSQYTINVCLWRVVHLNRQTLQV